MTAKVEEAMAGGDRGGETAEVWGWRRRRRWGWRRECRDLPVRERAEQHAKHAAVDATRPESADSSRMCDAPRSESSGQQMVP